MQLLMRTVLLALPLLLPFRSALLQRTQRQHLLDSQCWHHHDPCYHQARWRSGLWCWLLAAAAGTGTAAAAAALAAEVGAPLDAAAAVVVVVAAVVVAVVVVPCVV
jgi:hypothetical protein